MARPLRTRAAHSDIANAADDPPRPASTLPVRLTAKPTGKPTASPPPKLLSPRAAWYLTWILSESAPPPGYAQPADPLAFKTGSSHGFRDAWAIGYSADYTVGAATPRASAEAMVLAQCLRLTWIAMVFLAVACHGVYIGLAGEADSGLAPCLAPALTGLLLGYRVAQGTRPAPPRSPEGAET